MQVFCVICLDHCSQDDRLSVIMNCGHVFHAQCLLRWLHENSNCPQCRRFAGGNAIKNLYIDAGPGSPRASDATEEREALIRSRVATELGRINSLNRQLKEQAKRHKEQLDLIEQRHVLQINEALQRYKYIEKLLEEGTAELNNSTINGERSWKNLASVLKRRLSLVTAENRDLKARGKNLHSNVVMAGGRGNRSSMVPHVMSPVAGSSNVRTPPPAQFAAAAAAASNTPLPVGLPNTIGNDWSFEYSAEMFRTPENRGTLNWNFYFRNI